MTEPERTTAQKLQACGCALIIIGFMLTFLVALVILVLVI